jgi:hypothetical protein
MINTDIKNIDEVNAASENKPHFINGIWNCEINKIETLLTQKSQKEAIKIQFKGLDEAVKDALCNMWITKRDEGDKGYFFFEQNVRRLYVIARDYFGVSEERLKEEAESNWDLVVNIVNEITRALGKKKKIAKSIPVKYFREDKEGAFANVQWFPKKEDDEDDSDETYGGLNTEA